MFRSREHIRNLEIKIWCFFSSIWKSPYKAWECCSDARPSHGQNVPGSVSGHRVPSMPPAHVQQPPCTAVPIKGRQLEPVPWGLGPWVVAPRFSWRKTRPRHFLSLLTYFLPFQEGLPLIGSLCRAECCFEGEHKSSLGKEIALFLLRNLSAFERRENVGL